jgi:hypothetical protein
MWSRVLAAIGTLLSFRYPGKDFLDLNLSLASCSFPMRTGELWVVSEIGNHPLTRSYSDF